MKRKILFKKRVTLEEFSNHFDDKSVTLELKNVVPTGFQIIIAMGIGSLISNFFK